MVITFLFILLSGLNTYLALETHSHFSWWAAGFVAAAAMHAFFRKLEDM